MIKQIKILFYLLIYNKKIIKFSNKKREHKIKNNIIFKLHNFLNSYNFNYNYLF